MGCSNDNLLGPSKMVIKPYNTGFIAIKGASTLEQMFLNGIEIPYYSVSKQIGITLNSGESTIIKSNGDNHSFLLIRVDYPTTSVEPDHYVTLTRGGVTQYISYLYLETTNSKYRNSPITISNPGLLKVNISYMIATIDNKLEFFPKTTTINNNMIIDNLMFDDIKSSTDKNNIWIYQNGDLKTTINVSKIVNYWKDSFSIYIDDVADGVLQLKFIDNWNASQALSSISWFLSDTLSRTLPQSADISAPTITYKNSVIFISGQGYFASLSLNSGTIPGILTRNDLMSKLVLEIVDLRDGLISLDDDLLSIAQGSIIKDTISQNGIYTIYLTVSDIAGNQKIDSIQLTIS